MQGFREYSKSKESLSGEIRNITFYNEENGYSVLKLSVKKRSRSVIVTACGNIYQPYPGEILHLEGTWVNNRDYGLQFTFSSFQRTYPQSREGIIKYLSSSMVKGIGKHYAEKIVDCFGNEAFETIEKYPERLKDIKGIGEKRIQELIRSWKNQVLIRDIIMFLSQYGINLNYAAKIFKAFGDDSIEQLKRDPYVLAEKIRGIGFKTADAIARKLNIREDSLSRIKSGVFYALMNDTDSGNTMTSSGQLLKKSQELLGIEASLIGSCIDNLVKDELIYIIEREGGVYYCLPSYFFAEIKISRMLSNILNSRFFINIKSIDRAIEWVQLRISINLTDNQKEAIAGVIKNKISVVTGGPGTGKTTIVRAIHSIYRAKKARIGLLSPTGKAAKRLSEVTGQPASTIHRMLGSIPQTSRFVKNETNRLHYDILVIDEFSMVDLLLFYNLLKAVDEHTKLILIGDADQLPSVGPGDVLHSIIKSGRIFTAELNQIFRQKHSSRIISAAHRIRQGLFPYLPEYKVDNRNDLYLYKIDDRRSNNQEMPVDAVAEESKSIYSMEKTQDIPNAIIKIIKYDIPKITGIGDLCDIQVLTSLNSGVCGTHNLNLVLQEFFNPKNPSVTRYGRLIRVNDKVMQITNNYDKFVFNGDSGVVTGIDFEERRVRVRFDSRTVEYGFDELDELVLSYAISVHKSQGSEFPVIIFPIITSHYMMLKRNLIYTGITRAKKLAVLLGSKRAIAIAIGRDSRGERLTYLMERIEQAVNLSLF